MSSQGFDTWIFDVQDAGLSVEVRPSKVKQLVKFSTVIKKLVTVVYVTALCDSFWPS
ncbi:hypothetical protein LguiB_022884 [Lonicera macranthoides]